MFNLWVLVDHTVLEKGPAQPLLLKYEEQKDGEGEQECDGSEETVEESHGPANSIASAYRLLTPSVKVRMCLIHSISIN